MNSLSFALISSLGEVSSLPSWPCFTSNILLFLLNLVWWGLNFPVLQNTIKPLCETKQHRGWEEWAKPGEPKKRKKKIKKKVETWKNGNILLKSNVIWKKLGWQRGIINHWLLLASPRALEIQPSTDWSIQMMSWFLCGRVWKICGTKINKWRNYTKGIFEVGCSKSGLFFFFFLSFFPETKRILNIIWKLSQWWDVIFLKGGKWY